MAEHVWLAKRIYEHNVVYEDVFVDKSDAKEELASKQGGHEPDDFEWEGLNWEGDESEVVDEELELGERLVVEKKRLR